MRTKTTPSDRDRRHHGTSHTVAVSTGCAYELDIPTEQTVVALAEMDVVDVEVFVQGQPEMDPGYVTALAQTCRDLGLRVGSVHPYVFGFENLLYTSYRRQWLWALRQYDRYLAICAELGADYYVAHGPPRHHVMRDGRLTHAYLTRTAELARSAHDHGVQYCLENVSYGLVRDVADAVEHREALDVPVPFVLDFKSAWKAGARPQDFVGALAGDIVFAHVSFQDRANDRFGVCPVGDSPDPDVTTTVQAMTQVGNTPTRLVTEVFGATSLADIRRTVAAVRSHVTPAAYPSP